MKVVAFLALALAVASPAAAQIAPPIRQVESGIVDIATSAELAPILQRVGAEFTRQNPSVRVRIAPVGSNVAFSCLTTAKADIAIVGRNIADQEAKGFEWVYLEPPAGEPVFRGSARLAGHSPRIAVIVARSSPIRSLTKAELARRILPGGEGSIVMPDAESGTGRYFRQRLLGGANQLDWARISEIEEADHRRPGAVAGTIASIVARDPEAIGLADATPRPGVREVPVSDAGALFERQVLAYRHPSRRTEAAAFLAFLKGKDGQALIAQGPYRPLE